jgi:hypothetical protein
MSLKEDLVALNVKHKNLVKDFGIGCFNRLSAKCKEAAEKGGYEISVPIEEVPPVAWKLLVEEGLTIKEYSERNETTVLISWE